MDLISYNKHYPHLVNKVGKSEQFKVGEARGKEIFLAPFRIE